MALTRTATSRGWAWNAGMVVAGTLCLWLSAKIQVPFWPVPMTMQSLAVVLIGVAFGPALGATTVLAYLAEGAAGLPVFAGPTAGIAAFAGPTAGYLIGFVAAAGLTGWLAAHGWGRGPRLAATLLAGHAALFAPGIAWLTVASGKGWAYAVAVGLTPFLLGTAIKCALGVALTEAARARA